MDLLERYLQAVKFWLPKGQQEDIIAEVSEDLHSQAEDREAALGRSLTPDEWKALLKERGHPILVANRFLPQRSLIGPVLFPVYWFVLKIVLFFSIVPSLVVRLAIDIIMPSLRGEHAGSLAGSLFSSLWLTAMISTFLVTLTFALIERYHKNWCENWNPEKLPPVRHTRPIPRLNSLIEAVVDILFAAWSFQALMSSTMLDTPELRIGLTPAGSMLLAGLAALALGAGGIATVNLVRPYWTRTRHGFRAALHLASAVIFFFVYRAGPLMDITGSAIPSDKTADVIRFVNSTMASILLAAILIAAVNGAWELWRALRRTPVDSLAANPLTLVS